MLGRQKLQQMRELMNNPEQAAPIQRIASIIAELERSQTESVNDLADALDADHVGLDPVDTDAREAEMLALIGVMTPGGDGSLAGWYADHRLDDLEGAALTDYVAMDPDDWDAQMADRDRDEMAELVRETFGDDSLDDFEERVISVTRRDIVKDGLVGRLVAVEDEISAAAEAARSE